MAPNDPGDPDKDLYFDVASLKKQAVGRVGRNSTFIMILAALKLVLHLGSTIVLARLIPPDEFGVVAVALPVVAIGLALSEFGLGQAVVQAPRINHRVVSMLFWVNMGFSLFIALAFALAALPAARFFNEPRTADIFYWFALSVFLNGSVSQYSAILRRRLELDRLEYVNLFAFVASTLIAIVAAALGASYWAIVMQQVLGAALTAGLLVLLVPWRPALPSGAGLSGSWQHLGFGVNLTVSNLVQTLGKSLPVIVVGRALGPVDAGLLQRGTTLADLLPLRIARPLNGVYVSTLSKFHDDPRIFRQVFEGAVIRINLILVPFAVILFSCSEVIVPALFGAAWRDLAPVLAWLSLVLLQTGPERALFWSIIASGKGRVLLFYGLFGLIIMIVVLLAQIDKGIVVLAASIVLSQQFVRLPFLAVLALKGTSLDLPTILRPTLIDATGAVVAMAVIAGLRDATGASGFWPEMALAVGVVGTGVALRIGLTPSLRARVLLKTVAMLRKAR